MAGFDLSGLGNAIGGIGNFLGIGSSQGPQTNMTVGGGSSGGSRPSGNQTLFGGGAGYSYNPSNNNQIYSGNQPTRQFGQIQQGQQQQQPQQQQSSGGGNYQQQGQQQQGQQAGGQSTPGQPSIDFDALIRPAIQGYEDYIGQLQGTSQNTIGSLEAQRGTQTQQAQAGINDQLNTLNRTQTDQTQQGQNAIDDAKRMYGEMSQGLLSCYGTGSSAGIGFTELAQRQNETNISQIQQGLQRNMQDISDKRNQVNTVGQLALQDLNQRFDSTVQKVRDDLANTIAGIKSQEGTLQMQKAQMAATAIQHYQDTINNLNANREQQANQYKIAQMQADTQLQLWGNRLSSIGKTALPANLGQISQNVQSSNITPQVAQTPQDQGYISANMFGAQNRQNQNNPFNMSG